MSQVSLKGTLRCQTYEVSQLRAALPDHIVLTRHERGCLYFEIRPDASDPTLFHVSERFEDEAAFLAHQERTRASRWWEVTSHMERDFTVTSA